MTASNQLLSSGCWARISIKIILIFQINSTDPEQEKSLLSETKRKVKAFLTDCFWLKVSISANPNLSKLNINFRTQVINTIKTVLFNYSK